MRALLLLLLTLGIARAGAGTIAEAKLLNENRTVALTVNGQRLEFQAGPEHFWNFLLTSGDGDKAFALLENGDKNSWWHDGVYEFSPADYARAPKAYKPRLIELRSGAPTPRETAISAGRDGLTVRMGSDSKVVGIYAASADGGVLLVSLHYGLKGETGTEMPLTYPSFSYREDPWFLDTRTGRVWPVKP